MTSSIWGSGPGDTITMTVAKSDDFMGPALSAFFEAAIEDNRCFPVYASSTDRTLLGCVTGAGPDGQLAVSWVLGVEPQPGWSLESETVPDAERGMVIGAFTLAEAMFADFFGALSELGPAPSSDDMDEVRRDIWSNFPRELPTEEEAE